MCVSILLAKYPTIGLISDGKQNLYEKNILHDIFKESVGAWTEGSPFCLRCQRLLWLSHEKGGRGVATKGPQQALLT